MPPCLLQALVQHSQFYYDAQRVGVFPADNVVTYRSSALLQELQAGPGGSDLSGGWIEGGSGGNLKLTVPIAFTTAQLAWGLLSFPKVKTCSLLVSRLFHA